MKVIKVAKLYCMSMCTFTGFLATQSVDRPCDFLQMSTVLTSKERILLLDLQHHCVSICKQSVMALEYAMT